MPRTRFHRWLKPAGKFMTAVIRPGERVKVYLDSTYWRSAGWFEGSVIRIDPYSDHRNFYWVELDMEVLTSDGGRTHLISVLNPKNIVRL